MSNDVTLPARDGPMMVDSTRRRRAQSKDSDSRPSCKEDRPAALTQKQYSPTINNFSRRRKLKMRTRGLQKLFFKVLDFLVFAYVLRTVLTSLRRTSDEETRQRTSPPIVRALDPTISSIQPFEEVLDGAPTCDKLEPDDVSFTLAVALSDNRLGMMKHHCELWGTAASISVAIWTRQREDDIMQKLRQMGCDLAAMNIQIVSSQHQSNIEFPINMLRNVALRSVTTSHVLLLDVDFWESVDLFDTLNLPSIRKALSLDPKVGLVIPAFETQDLKCGTDSNCLSKKRGMIPKDFEDLVISLSANRTLPYDAQNFAHQGSTDYRKWMRQNHGDLIDIPCVSSNHYQPYVVVRLCNELPPFQEVFTGYGRNHMEWILHLRRVGYSFKQLGGSFVSHVPHHDSPAKIEWNKEHQNGEARITSHLRGRIDDKYMDFVKWLDANVPDNSRLKKCESFEDDEVNQLNEER